MCVLEKVCVRVRMHVLESVVCVCVCVCAHVRVSWGERVCVSGGWMCMCWNEWV